MKRYSASCTLRNRKGKSIGGRNPLWEGGAEDARGAIAAAHEAIPPLLTPEVDTIVLTIRGPGGELLSATEYAEDFTIGYGASAIGSTGLTHDQLDINLTDEQKAEAEELFKRRAINALPEDIKRKLVEEGKAKADPLDALIDRHAGNVQNPPKRWTPQHVERARAKRKSIEEMARLDPKYDVLGKIWEAVTEFYKTTGRRIKEVLLSAEAAHILAQQMKLPAGHAPTHGMIYGYPYMVRQGQTEPITLVPEPRAGFATGGVIGTQPTVWIADEVPDPSSKVCDRLLARLRRPLPRSSPFKIRSIHYPNI